jgi:hypothetical protein
MLNKTELTKAVARYARRHNTSADFIRTNTATLRDAIAEWNASKPKRNHAQQYRDAKDAAPNCLLFFIVGDFAEVFYDDAKTVSQFFGLTLRTRGPAGKEGGDVPMTGFPKCYLDKYLKELEKFGFRFSIVTGE